MLHSIIIPYRNRPRRLKLCLDRIRNATRRGTRLDEIEVVVVTDSLDCCSTDLHPFAMQWIVSLRKRGTLLFNKPRLLNAGIEAARGLVLTFLDVDSMVGEKFFEGAEFAFSPRITKVCYRVRALAEEALEKAEADPEYLDRQFDVYDTHARRFEAHTAPDANMQVGEPIFGNSQFSISREKLGDLRYDEGYEGAGFEDIAMNMAIWVHYGTKYHACKMTDADHAILDFQNEKEPDWKTDEQFIINRERYMRSCPWNNTPES